MNSFLTLWTQIMPLDDPITLLEVIPYVIKAQFVMLLFSGVFDVLSSVLNNMLKVTK